MSTLMCVQWGSGLFPGFIDPDRVHTSHKPDWQTAAEPKPGRLHFSLPKVRSAGLLKNSRQHRWSVLTPDSRFVPCFILSETTWLRVSGGLVSVFSASPTQEVNSPKSRDSVHSSGQKWIHPPLKQIIPTNELFFPVWLKLQYPPTQSLWITRGLQTRSGS